jgi:hypothetical protein
VQFLAYALDLTQQFLDDSLLYLGLGVERAPHGLFPYPEGGLELLGGLKCCLGFCLLGVLERQGQLLLGSIDRRLGHGLPLLDHSPDLSQTFSYQI